jgi:hypothetical protein
MARRRQAQAILADEGQVGIGRVLAGGGAGARDRRGIGGNVGIEILQAQEVAAGGVGERSHPIDTDTHDVAQARWTWASMT